MKLYADTTGRRTRQLLSDVLVLLWVATWAYAGRRSTTPSSSCADPPTRSPRPAGR